MENSKGWSQDTALSRRVQDWEDKMRPLLVEQVRAAGPAC